MLIEKPLKVTRGDNGAEIAPRDDEWQIRIGDAGDDDVQLMAVDIHTELNNTALMGHMTVKFNYSD